MEGEITIERNVAERYERQAIMKEIGLSGQRRIEKGSVLVVGLGGLGCPCALYLAGAGVGTLGLLDDDTVERTNLHRQILHREDTVGKTKVESAVLALRERNSEIEIVAHPVRVSQENVASIVGGYDVVVDATDSAATRLVLNDGGVLRNRPLVSGAVMGAEGQATVYNYLGGPCYRCINPVQPSPDQVLRCDETGVLGPIAGMFGCILATESVKILSRQSELAGKMLLYNGVTMFLRLVRQRGRQSSCAGCGEKSPSAEIRGMCSPMKAEDIFETEHRVTWDEYGKIRALGRPQALIDVREADEYDAVRVSGAINIPLSGLVSRVGEVQRLAGQGEIYLLCRRGVRSKKAAEILRRHGVYAKDIIGGMCVFDEKQAKAVLIKG
ncbi:MAG: molybdopterin synthase sulfurylase [Amphiamblys sp. WSBS2006]|nr:MAG: molybdopterin synthase sulfurylase [Amphiamblys sp. WSBS2006]